MVFTKSVMTDDVEMRIHGYQVLRRPWEVTEMMKLIRSSETMNPCSVSIVYKWHERLRNARTSTEDEFEGWSALVVKMSIKDITF